MQALQERGVFAIAKEVREHIKTGSYTKIEEIIRTEFQFDERSFRKFVWTIGQNDPEERYKAIRLLLFCGVPLNLAKVFDWERKQDGELIQEFLNHGWKVDSRSISGPTLLCVASSRPDLDLLHWLLEHGADPNVEQHQNPEYLTSYHTPTFNATGLSETSSLESLISNGAKLDPGALFPAMLGNTYGYFSPDTDIEPMYERMRWLIERKIDVNGVGPVLYHNSKNYHPESPLHFAVGLRREKYIRLLLEHGANREHERFGDSTPAALALKLGYSEIYELISNWPSSAT